MRRFAMLLSLLTAVPTVLTNCSSDIGDSVENAADARPIDFREPPKPKEGSGTAEGCEGVTARGECQSGEAVYCDLDRGQLRKVDCKAMGRNCIVDVARGAVCKELEDVEGNQDQNSPCSDTGVSEAGFCTDDGQAVFCSTAGDKPTTVTWDCSANDMTCGVDECGDGAWCCGEEFDCGELDFDGVCEDGVAKWCTPEFGPTEIDCAANGQRCEVDTCVIGAGCCGEGDLCSELGLEGECVDDQTGRYCIDGEIEEFDCGTGTLTCQVDACGNGAYCCEEGSVEENECTELGFDGICVDANTARYCDGTTDEDIVVVECEAGESCQVDVCAQGAYCCEDRCATIGVTGECVENTLEYCLGGEIKQIDCSATGQECKAPGDPGACFNSIAACCDISV